jgi:hypothetical protein
MTATEEVEEIKKRKVLDTPGLKRLIAKVKKGDADNAAEIENLKAEGLIVANGQLRFG